MKTKLTLTAIALAVLAPATAAFADDDDCTVPRDQWQPREAVFELAAQNGWTVREFEVDDGCYEIEGRDSDGRRIEVVLDPATLAVVEMEYEDDDDSKNGSNRNNPAAAGTVAPPQNGLFVDGAAPPVQTQ